MSSEEEGSGSVPRVLARNSACHQCRKRKLKCDANKPTCTNCQRHNNRQANASKPKPVECTWDAPRRERKRYDDSEDVVLGAKKAKMAELEGKIADYERALSQQRAGLPAQSRVVEPPSYPPREGESSQLAHTPSNEDIWPAKYSIPSRVQKLDNVPWERHNENAEAMPLVWPNWPVDLPSLDVIEHVVGVFFERVPTIPRMLHKSTFKANLRLPPTHWKFPARSLLHSILAVTANHLPVEDLATRRYFPTGTPSTSLYHPEHDFEVPGAQDRTFPLGAFHTADAPVSAGSPFARFQLWHRRKAMASMSHHIDKGEKFLECIQAQVITTTVDQYNAWWTDLWMMSGSAMRLAIPTRLNESSKLPMDGLMTGAHVILEPARDALEQACRDRTWWMVYLLERSVTLSTCWSPSLPDAEITAELPVLQSTFDRGWGELDGVQSFNDPDFYSYHPERHMDSMVFYIKSIRLVTEMNSFFRAYSRTAHSVSKYTNEPRVRVLLSQINSFRLSFPPKFRRPTQDLGEGAPDIEALAAIMMTHVMTIMLGEPLITKDTWRSDLARMSLTAIRASLSLLYDITATSFDVTLLPHLCAFCWGVASGALCRFILAASETGDSMSAGVFRSEVQVFRMALQQYAERYPVGQRQIKMLDETLESTTAGMGGQDVFHCGAKELLDPDYRPGSLKFISQGSVESIGTSGDTLNLLESSSSSPRISSRGLPLTPDSQILEKAKLRGRTETLRKSLGDTGTGPIDHTGLPLPLSSYDQKVEHVALAMSTLPHEFNRPPKPVDNREYAMSGGMSSEFTHTYTHTTTPLNHSNAGGSSSMGIATPTGEAQYGYQNFMTMAMGMTEAGDGGLELGSHIDNNFTGMGLGGGGGGDFGFGFDINNFSFDVGDFSTLLGPGLGPRHGHGNGHGYGHGHGHTGQGGWDSTTSGQGGSGYV